MDRKLINYLPPFLREYKELKNITEAEQPEIEEAWEAVEKLLEEPFVFTQSNYGASRLEKILGIQSFNTDTLEVRNFRILSKLNEVLPYTKRTILHDLIELCEKENFELELDIDHAVLHIVIKLWQKGKILEIMNYLERILPMNILIDFLQKLESTVRKEFCICSTASITMLYTVTGHSKI